MFIDVLRKSLSSNVTISKLLIASIEENTKANDQITIRQNSKCSFMIFRKGKEQCTNHQIHLACHISSFSALSILAFGSIGSNFSFK